MEYTLCCQLQALHVTDFIYKSVWIVQGCFCTCITTRAWLVTLIDTLPDELRSGMTGCLAMLSCLIECAHRTSIQSVLVWRLLNVRQSLTKLRWRESCMLCCMCTQAGRCQDHPPVATWQRRSNFEVKLHSACVQPKQA